MTWRRAGLLLAAILAASAVAAQEPAATVGAPTPTPAPGPTPAQTPTAAAVPLPSPTPPEGAGPAATPILVLDREALWVRSAWGQRVTRQIEAERDAIAAENDRLAAELEAEDAALTELRKTLPAQEFRARADAFDAKVSKVRADRDAAARALADKANAERDAFLRAALPVIGAAIQRRGAQVLLDRQTVFLSADAIDVTEELIAAVDAAIGPGQ